MGDPITLALGAQAGSSIFDGLAGSAEAKGEKQRAEINAYIGRTRAIQSDTDARVGLNDELSTMRAALAANGQKQNTGTMALFDELRRQRGRERRVEYGNHMAEVADWKMAGKNAGAKAKAAMFGGLIKAGSSLFDLYNYKKA